MIFPSLQHCLPRVLALLVPRRGKLWSYPKALHSAQKRYIITQNTEDMIWTTSLHQLCNVKQGTMELQWRYNGEVPSPPPLTPLPVMAVEIHRGALALLAWIRSPATSQIIVHLLNFLVSFAGCKVYLSWCTCLYLDIAMRSHPIFWGSWMVTIIVILAILLSFHISQSDIWQISTLWYLTNFHTLMSSSMHLTTCHRDPSTISSSWHFAWYDGEKCLPGNHCNHHLVVVSQGFYASKNLGQFSLR